MQLVIGEQTGRKVTTSMGEETKQKKGQKMKGEEEKITSLSPSPCLTIGRKALYTLDVIQCPTTFPDL